MEADFLPYMPGAVSGSERALVFWFFGRGVRRQPNTTLSPIKKGNKHGSSLLDL